MDLSKSIAASTSGLRAQAAKMRVISENIANEGSTGSTATEDPYRRRVPTFKALVDRESGVTKVEVDKIKADKSDFKQIYKPGHPAADANGYVRMPNVDGVVEQADMRDAQRAYEANINAIEAARSMTSKTIDLIR